MINREIHDFYANMESLNGDIACPGLSKHWNYYDGGAREWVILSDLKIECHGSRCGSDEDNCEKHDCDENAYCTVNPFVKDGYVYNCLDGYEGNGKTCRLPCTAEGGLDDEHYKVVVDEDNASYIDQVKKDLISITSVGNAETEIPKKRPLVVWNRLTLMKLYSTKNLKAIKFGIGISRKSYKNVF